MRHNSVYLDIFGGLVTSALNGSLGVKIGLIGSAAGNAQSISFSRQDFLIIFASYKVEKPSAGVFILLPGSIYAYGYATSDLSNPSLSGGSSGITKFTQNSIYKLNTSGTLLSAEQYNQSFGYIGFIC